MDGKLYVEILENFLVPFIKESFHRTEYWFMQDNDPKYMSHVAKALYAEEGINWWPTPASSADLNPIERVWRELKYFIAKRVKPLSKHELIEGICLFWRKRMAPAKCIKYLTTLLPFCQNCRKGGRNHWRMTLFTLTYL